MSASSSQSTPPNLPPDDAPSSRSPVQRVTDAGHRAAAAAKRSPVTAAAAAGTGGIVTITALIEVLKALHEIGGSGIIWQVSALVIVVLWVAAAYAGWQGQLAQQRRDASAQLADRAEKREERTLGVIESAIVELKEGQATLTRTQEALMRTVEGLALEVRALYSAIDSETAARLRKGT